MSIEQEKAFDYNTVASRSDIDIESANYTGDIGLQDWVVERNYSDYILVEYVDVTDGLTTASNGLYTSDNSVKSWRKGVVRVISPMVEQFGQTKVGDYVLFPNDKGLRTGTVTYINQQGETAVAKEAVYLNEPRILSKLRPKH